MRDLGSEKGIKVLLEGDSRELTRVMLIKSKIKEYDGCLGKTMNRMKPTR